MTLALRSVGQVIHLIQDLSQPSHVRNDNHRLKHYIENWGEAHLKDINFDSPQVLDWFACGFGRLEDFWDRGLYTGSSATPLINDNGQQTLGLAEFSNGNFLSEDRLYRELSIGYAYPSLYSGTNFSQLNTNPLGAAQQVFLRDGTAAGRLLLSKTGDGVPVTNHSALGFLTYKKLTTLGSGLGVSICDDAVLADYHAILIPKAMAYSGGAIDYFFRGKLGVRLRWDEYAGKYKLGITNASSQKFKGGAFTLYKDDDTGSRSALALTMSNPWNDGSTLEPNDSVEATFQAPGGMVSGYMLVYKGTIGTDGSGSAADPVDAGIAIAAHQFKILRFNIKWDPKSDIDLYLVDPDGTIISYEHKQSDLGELDIDNIGNTGPENITLKTVIDGEYQVWVNYYADWFFEDPNTSRDPETRIAVTMKTYFNSSAVVDTGTFTLNQPNFGADRPVGTTGPATQANWHIRKLVKILDGKITEH